MKASLIDSPAMLSLQTRMIWATRRFNPLQRPLMHYRAGVTVWNLESGGVTISTREGEVRFAAPCWLLLGPGWSTHAFDEGSWLLSISVRIQSHEGPFLTLPPMLPINRPDALARKSPALVKLYGQRFHNREAMEEAFYQLKVHAAVAEWSLQLGRLLRRVRPETFLPRLKHPGLRLAMEWLNDHITEQKVNEPALAKAGGMSVSHFKRVFQRELGMPLREYLRGRKIDACVEALLHTDKSIKQIGVELGFTDPANFVRWFRQHFNQSPGAYREPKRR